MTDRALVDAATRLRDHHEPYLVLTAVRGHARMLLTRFGWIAGGVRGRCLGGGFQPACWAHTRDGHAIVLRVDPDDDDLRAFDDVLVERAGIAGRLDALELTARCIANQCRGAIATVIRSAEPAVRLGARLALVGDTLELEPDAPAHRDAIVTDLHAASETAVRSHGAVDVLVEVVLPPPRLFVFGAGHDAVSIAQLAHDVGWDVIVVAPRPDVTTRERFAAFGEVVVAPAADLAARIDGSYRAAVIVAGRDREGLAFAVRTRAGFIGVLGSCELADPRIRELPIGTSQDVALSIVSEVRDALSQPTRPAVVAA